MATIHWQPLLLPDIPIPYKKALERQFLMFVFCFLAPSMLFLPFTWCKGATIERRMLPCVCPLSPNLFLSSLLLFLLDACTVHKRSLWHVQFCSDLSQRNADPLLVSNMNVSLKNILNTKIILGPGTFHRNSNMEKCEFWNLEYERAEFII